MYNGETKDTTATFRTSSRVKAELDSLADRVNERYYDFPWRSPIRECKTKSGLLHALADGQVTREEIEQELKKLEAADDSTE